MNIELIISLFALAISFLTYIRYRVNLKFKVLKCSYYLDSQDFPLNGYPKGKYIIVSFKISNSSARPISVDEVYALRDKAFAIDSIELYHREIKLESIKVYANSNTYNKYVLKPIAKLPIRIQPYDSVYCSFCFLWVEKLKQPFEIYFVTPRKDYRVTLDRSQLLHKEHLHSPKL